MVCSRRLFIDPTSVINCHSNGLGSRYLSGRRPRCVVLPSFCFSYRTGWWTRSHRTLRHIRLYLDLLILLPQSLYTWYYTIVHCLTVHYLFRVSPFYFLEDEGQKSLLLRMAHDHTNGRKSLLTSTKIATKRQTFPWQNGKTERDPVDLSEFISMEEVSYHKLLSGPETKSSCINWQNTFVFSPTPSSRKGSDTIEDNFG